jgi:hypothetical protein
MRSSLELEAWGVEIRRKAVWSAAVDDEMQPQTESRRDAGTADAGRERRVVQGGDRVEGWESEGWCSWPEWRLLDSKMTRPREEALSAAVMALAVHLGEKGEWQAQEGRVQEKEGRVSSWGRAVVVSVWSGCDEDRECLLELWSKLWSLPRPRNA